MKKKNYLLASMLLAAFAACDNESSMDMTTEPPAEFTAHVGKQKVQTRMADDTWDNGDCIGIFALNDDCAENYPGPQNTSNAYANGKYKYDGTERKWNFDSSGDLPKPYYFKNPNTTVVTFKAYYPWQPNANITAAGNPSKIDNGTIAIDAGDQSLKEQKKYDFLFADKAPTSVAEGAQNNAANEGKPWGSKESTSVNFQFTHSMVKLVFILKPGTTNGITLEAVKSMTPFLEGIKSKGTFSLADGQVTATTDENVTDLELKNKTEVSASDGNDESVQFVAIVVPQATPANAILRLEEPLAASGKDKYITKKLFSNLGNDGLKAGHQYTYTLTVKKMELVITSFGITVWQNTDMTDADDAVLQ